MDGKANNYWSDNLAVHNADGRSAPKFSEYIRSRNLEGFFFDFGDNHTVEVLRELYLTTKPVAVEKTRCTDVRAVVCLDQWSIPLNSPCPVQYVHVVSISKAAKPVKQLHIVQSRRNETEEQQVNTICLNQSVWKGFANCPPEVHLLF